MVTGVLQVRQPDLLPKMTADMNIIVCGEPCEIQQCTVCTPNNSDPVVDLIMNVRMSELDPHGEDLENLLITLECGHVFTVETLDGICELERYYTRHNGRWQDLAPPPQGLQKRPVCPMCRGPINSHRYGRVFKRADLDCSEMVHFQRH